MNDPHPLPTDAPEPCPFCGAAPESSSCYFAFECETCGAHGPTADSAGDEAIALWNRRTPSPVGVEPVEKFDNPLVQAVYAILCDDTDWPPKETPQQHWEGWIARRIVDQVLAMGQVPQSEALRLFDAGWKAAARFCGREDVVADGVIGFGACPQFEAAFKAAIAAQQGDTK